MNKEEYIKQCGVSSSRDLTDEQILSYFIKGNGCSFDQSSAIFLKEGKYLGIKLDVKKGMAMLRRAFEEDKVLTIHYIESEGVVNDVSELTPPSIEMVLTDRFY